MTNLELAERLFEAYQVERNRVQGISLVRWSSLQILTQDEWVAVARASRRHITQEIADDLEVTMVSDGFDDCAEMKAYVIEEIRGGAAQ